MSSCSNAHVLSSAPGDLGLPPSRLASRLSSSFPYHYSSGASSRYEAEAALMVAHAYSVGPLSFGNDPFTSAPLMASHTSVHTSEAIHTSRSVEDPEVHRCLLEMVMGRRVLQAQASVGVSLLYRDGEECIWQVWE